LRTGRSWSDTAGGPPPHPSSPAPGRSVRRAAPTQNQHSASQNCGPVVRLCTFLNAVAIDVASTGGRQLCAMIVAFQNALRATTIRCSKQMRNINVVPRACAVRLPQEPIICARDHPSSSHRAVGQRM
jgi:hypothetical protein